MDLNQDKITSLIYKAIDILLMKAPEKTAFGILFGTFLSGSKSGLVKITEGKIKLFLEDLNFFTIFLFGILVIRFPVVLKKDAFNQDRFKEFSTMSKMIEESGLSGEEKSKRYKELIAIELDNYKADSLNKKKGLETIV